MIYAFSIIMIVVSNVFYNITQKSTPGGVNPFAALLVTYLTAGVAMFSALAYSQLRDGRPIAESFRGITWTSLLLGGAIIGLELGYLMAYRAGWDISKASLIANIVLALLLIPVGILFYHESFNPAKIAGILFCIAGLFLINR